MNDQLIEQYLREIILLIHDRIQTLDLSKREGADMLKSEVDRLLDQFGVVVEEAIPESILTSYFAGVDEASAALLQSGLITTSAAAMSASGTINKPFRKNIHLQAIAEILDDTMLDLQAAIRTAKRSAITTIDSTLENVQKDLAKGLIQGEPRKVITAHVARSFESGGLTSFITKDNRRLPLDFYAMTVTRTKTRVATVTGSSKRYEDAGQDLIQIVENRDTCPVCARYNGMVLSLTGNTPGYPVANVDIPLPPYHPNCRGTTRPYVIEQKSERDIQRDKDRNARFDPGKDVRTKAEREAYEDEQRKRRQANAEKKQYARWKMALGPDAPKTIGAFRRMKRANSIKYQELADEYRSIMSGSR